MNIKYFNNKFPYTIIDNFYDDRELDLIWEELNFLCYYDKLDSPEQTGSAFDFNFETQTKEHLKNNYGFFLDDIYLKRSLSNILKCNRKIFDNKQVFENHPSWFFKHFSCNHDRTLLSYYENNGIYKFHSDSAYVTCLSWFYKEPRVFSGGNLEFETGETIELKNNRFILFPSMIKHSVTKISMEENYSNKKLGRFCITQFLYCT